MFLDMQCNKKVTSLWLFKLRSLHEARRFTRKTRRARTVHIKARSLVATTSIADVQDSHEVWWCECTQTRSASKSRPGDGPTGETSPAWQAKLALETRDLLRLQISFARFTAK